MPGGLTSLTGTGFLASTITEDGETEYSGTRRSLLVSSWAEYPDRATICICSAHLHALQIPLIALLQPQDRSSLRLTGQQECP